MAWPTVTVRVAFATAPFAAIPTWVDITTAVRSFSVRRGRQHELNRIEAGIATLVLDNSSGDFWPLNAAGTYYPNVLPDKKVNIRATYGGLTYDLFTGFAEGWLPSFAGGADKIPVINLTCSDLLANLALYKLNNAGYAEQRSDVRVGAVLDSLGWAAADRALSTGQTTIQATGALANVNALTHLRAVEATESGLLWVRGDGYVVFEDRHERLQNHDTSQAVYGDDVGELGYRDPIYQYDREQVRNDIRLTRTGGSEQTASDATSQTNHGPRTLSLTGLLQTGDGEVLNQADYLLARYKDPEFRVKQIAIRPESDPANLWPDVLGFDISTRITVRLNAGSIDADYHIEGIQHRATANPKVWETVWDLSPANAQAWWTLDSLTNSILNTTTRLAY